MSKLKYIVFQVGPFQLPIAWPDDFGLTHKAVARSGYIGEPISAGFTHAGEWLAFGRSESLGKESRPVDTEILRKHFGAAAVGAGLGVLLTTGRGEGSAAAPSNFPKTK